MQQDIDKCSSFSMLPRDISQQIFNELVLSHSLTDDYLEAFRDCALQVDFSWIISKLKSFDLVELRSNFALLAEWS